MTAGWKTRVAGKWAPPWLGPPSSGQPTTPPTAAFTSTVTNLSVAFDASSSTAGSAAIGSYGWDFGDGTKGTGLTPTHVYATAGARTVTLTATGTDGGVDTVSHSVTAVSTGGTEPSGAGIVGYETLTGSTFNIKVNSTATSNKVAFAAGTFTFSDFAINVFSNSTTKAVGGYGAEANGAGFLGSGIGKTIIEMVPNTSTKTSPPSGWTNGYHLLRFNRDNVILDGFTLQGTPQPNLYDGIRLSLNNPQISNLKIVAIPGNDRVPPGETFGLNCFSGSGGTTTNVEIDGAGVGASAFATNSWTGGHTYIDCYAHNNPYSAGVALWQHSGGATFTRFRSINNRTGINLERTTGTITFTDPTLTGNTAQDVYFGNDQSSNCQLVLAYTTAPPAKIRVRIPALEQGNTNRIGRGNVTITVGGVDRTSSYVTWL